MKTIVLILLLVSPLAFAGCASDAYQKACVSCQFDAQGKIEQSCSGGYKAGGTVCVSTTYPIAAAKYAQGNCSAIDDCASELSACNAQYSTGDDKADCQEGSLGVCYAAADVCVKQAAIKCGEIESPCKAPAVILALLTSTIFLRIRR